MVAWWSVAWAGAGLCRGLAPLDVEPLPEQRPPLEGRCLDTGKPSETLRKRALRCVDEDPTDPAPLRVLGVLGTNRDVAVLEQRALGGLHTDVASEALARLGTDEARAALVRVACFATDWPAAVAELAKDPRAEELELYVEGWHRGAAGAERAIGRVGTEEGRALLRQADMLMLDEPTSALDRKNSDSILALMKKLSAERLVIFTSHQWFALATADEVIQLDT